MDLENQINNSDFTYFFLVVDPFLDIKIYPNLKKFHLIYAYKNPKLSNLKQNKVPYFCLEEQDITLPLKNSGLLLSQPQVINYINTNSIGQSAIIPFKPSAKIDFLCHKYNWKNISNPARLNRLFEDKLKFVQFCQQNNLPVIPSAVDKLTLQNFEKYQKQFGKSLVIQTHFGWAGQSTLQANQWSDISQILEPNTKVKFSPYIKKSYSLLNNCCLTKQGLLQSPPALQYTGLPQFTQNPFSTVGRQWPSLASKNIHSQIKEITKNFSKILQSHNYLGFFGLDFLVDSSDKVYLLECNPRLTASFDFYTQLELKQKLTPLFYYHLATFSKIKFQLTQTEIDKRFSVNIIGSELTPKNESGQTLKKINVLKPLIDSLKHPIINPSDLSDD